MKAFFANLPVLGENYMNLLERAGLNNEPSLQAVGRSSIAEGIASDAFGERSFALVPQHPSFTGTPADLYTYAVNNWANVGFGGMRELLSLAIHIKEGRIPDSFLATNAEIFGFNSVRLGTRLILDHKTDQAFDMPDLVSPVLYVGKNGRAVSLESHTDNHRVGNMCDGSVVYTLLTTRYGPTPTDSLPQWEEWAQDPHKETA